MLGYYDIVLGLIPVALVGITAALLTVGLPTTGAVPIGALVAVGFMGHAMFVRAPTGSETSESAGTATPVNAD